MNGRAGLTNWDYFCGRIDVSLNDFIVDNGKRERDEGKR